MKVFISMPMNGKTDEQIKKEFAEISEKIKAEYGQVKILNSIFEYKEDNPIKYLAKSIALLAKADIVYFTHDWQQARGCSVERHVAEAYGKAIKQEV